MYHHIAKDNKFLYAINNKRFEQQIRYFKKNYNILKPGEFYNKLRENNFKKKDCILTFDDGYQSHYKYAYKTLNKYNLKGFFYPIMLGSVSSKIHPLNKIQIILKLSNDKIKILEEIKLFIKKNDEKTYKNLKKIIKKIKTKNFYDDATSIIIKRLLQRDLPFLLREKICDNLFKRIKFKKNSLKNFYMNDIQLRKLKKDGHEIGVHTKSHLWMSSLSELKQKKEINDSLEYLRRKKLIGKTWSFCYPFGDYNHLTIKILKKLNCSAAFAVKNEPMKTKKINKFELSRLDCNKFL